MPRLISSKVQEAKIIENHLNPVMLVFIEYSSPSVLSDEYPLVRATLTVVPAVAYYMLSIALITVRDPSI